MCICDSEAPSIFVQIERTARIEHKCCECGWMIQPASRYFTIAGLWEGKWSNYKQCLSCNQIGDRFVEETDCCYSIGDLYECLQESEMLEYDREAGIWVSKVDWIRISSQSNLKLLGLGKDENWVDLTMEILQFE